MESTPVKFLNGLAFRLRRLALLPRFIRLARQAYPTWREARLALGGLRQVIRENDRIRHITRGVRINGRLFNILSYPGGPSPAQDVFILNELHRIRPIPGHQPGLLLAIIAMTKKCSLRCAHCFEWDNLNSQDVLTAEDTLHIIHQFQRRGVAQIGFLGEPLNRYTDLLDVVQRSDTRASDFWILTSGYRLTADRAQALRAAGLTGVSVSLDHWDAVEHDHFRGLPGAFDWARQAVLHARQAGLAVGLSLTATKSFCTPAHLFHYAELAKSWNVHFIRILDPRAVGHYAGQPVELTSAEQGVLEEFVQTLQHQPHYRSYPIVDYYGTYQRTVGCSGAGERFVYVDTDGDLHACPFCQHKCGSTIHGTLTASLEKMRQAGGCHAFHTV